MADFELCLLNPKQRVLTSASLSWDVPFSRSSPAARPPKTHDPLCDPETLSAARE